MAQSVMFKLLPQSGELIWEHYNADWETGKSIGIIIREKQKTKLVRMDIFLVILLNGAKLLDQYAPEVWHALYAERLFRFAATKGVDRENGGIFYSMDDPNRRIIDTDKSYWVMAEAIGASALSASKIGQSEYRKWYIDIFSYCW
ncbi:MULTISPECIES: AGE family epimerase/isomerase [Paenibacillaceae]|nr:MULTISPECIES: AGE family epimerase/isomerase [Paenibacillaceae]